MTPFRPISGNHSRDGEFHLGNIHHRLPRTRPRGVPDSGAFVLSDFSTAQSRFLPGHRYEIDDRNGKPVSELGADETSIDLAELPPSLKSIEELIGEGSRESHPYDAPAYGADSLPDDLVRIIEEYDYVECVWEGKPVAIAFEIFENDVA